VLACSFPNTLRYHSFRILPYQLLFLFSFQPSPTTNTFTSSIHLQHHTHTHRSIQHHHIAIINAPATMDSSSQNIAVAAIEAIQTAEADLLSASATTDSQDMRLTSEADDNSHNKDANSSAGLEHGVDANEQSDVSERLH
jgi:hypothetical protein